VLAAHAPGVDFAEEIFRAVAACKVLLAIIGQGWLTAADERHQRRVDKIGSAADLLEAALLWIIVRVARRLSGASWGC
jgi:hypothetical protein